MNTNKILKLASNFERLATTLQEPYKHNSYYAHSTKLLSLGIGDNMPPAWEREQIAKIKSEIDSYNWSNGTASLEEFESGFNKFLTICEYLGSVPSPYGNPFSIGLVGNDLAKSDYTSAALHLLGGLPWFSLLRKSISLLKTGSFVIQIIKACPAVIRPAMKTVLMWLSDSIRIVATSKIAVQATIAAVSKILERLSSDLLIGTARKVDAEGFKSSLVNKSIQGSSFNVIDASLYLSDFLMQKAEKELLEVSNSVRRAI